MEIRLVENKASKATTTLPTISKDAKVLASLAIRTKAGKTFSSKAQVKGQTLELTGKTRKLARGEFLVSFSTSCVDGSQTSILETNLKLKLGETLVAAGGMTSEGKAELFCISLRKP